MYKIISQKDFPSWGYWIEQGATTLWEHWNGKYSRNHRMFGSISSWLYNCLAGIRPNEEYPGLTHIIIKPCFIEEINFVKAETLTNNGNVLVEWKRESDQISLKIVAPDECKVLVYIDQKNVHKMIHNHNYKVILD